MLFILKTQIMINAKIYTKTHIYCIQKQLAPFYIINMGRKSCHIAHIEFFLYSYNFLSIITYKYFLIIRPYVPPDALHIKSFSCIY